MKKPTRLQRKLLSPSQIKSPPFAFKVSGPSLCPGHLYVIGNRSDEQRAEYFAAIAMAAVTGRTDTGCWEEDTPGQVCVVAEIDQTNLIQDKMRLVAQAWGVDLAALERRLRFGSRSALSAQRLLRVLEGDTGQEPFALIIIDQLGVKDLASSNSSGS